MWQVIVIDYICDVFAPCLLVVFISALYIRATVVAWEKLYSRWATDPVFINWATCLKKVENPRFKAKEPTEKNTLCTHQQTCLSTQPAEHDQCKRAHYYFCPKPKTDAIPDPHLVHRHYAVEYLRHQLVGGAVHQEDRAAFGVGQAPRLLNDFAQKHPHVV